MAANNYFAGFTHGGTQYSAQPASAYAAPAQAAYVQPAQTAYAAAPRAQTYEAYPTTHSTGQYAYTAARTQATATYDTGKAYYAPAAAAAPAAATAVYTLAEPSYQAGFGVTAKASYSGAGGSTAGAYTAAAARQVASSKPAATPASTSYTYQTAAATTAPPSSLGAVAGARSGYDAAVYSAATNYYQHKTTTTGASATVGGAGGWAKKPYQQKMLLQKKMPPKPPQLHYCEVCKISCAGPQTYREHLEGQKHKKKEAAAKSTNLMVPNRALQNQLRCELCDVSCTGADAYAAHIRGAKHQKVLKLHTKLGKPIPSADPVVVSSTSAASKAPQVSAAATASAASKPTRPSVPSTPAATANTATAVKKVVATPKITFIGGAQLKTTGAKAEEAKGEGKVEAAVTATTMASSSTTTTPEDDKEDTVLIPGEKEVQPVGQEYIEDVRNEFGNVVSFHCKLCECKFNDPHAKVMHMKGRRHRLSYKKKVDPSLLVEMKPSIFGRKKQEEKLRRQAAKEEYWRRRDAEERWRMEWEQRRYEEELHQWQRMGGGRGMPFTGGAGPMMRRPDTSDDRHVMAKHASIYPNEQELQVVQNIVSSCEKSLKLVSDYLAETELPKPMDTDKKDGQKEGAKTEEKKEEKKEGEKEEAGIPPRALKGVMRVGVLAKGLLLHGDLNVHLVVLCSEKPTRTLLERVADCLPKQLATLCEEKYEVKICVEDAAVIVMSEKDPHTSCTITLTSPVMREENLSEGETVTPRADPPDVLDRQKCLDALAALRHAKWFQARANGLQSCVVVIRILRDLCQRVPTWTPLNQWAMELLVEKCVSSGGASMSPGDAVRRVFEALASGILLPGGPGLYDPCEKDPTDAASSLTNQEREDITASAQHALRLIAFRQIHKVLGMEPLPQPKFARGKNANPRKRRRTNSQGEAGEDEEGKKDKKEEGEGKPESTNDAPQS